MRFATGTKAGESGLVTCSTKAMMAFFGPMSFQEGRESPARTEAIKKARMHGITASVFMASNGKGFRF